MASYSEIMTWQRCERKYYYAFVVGLEPIETPVAPAFGTQMHQVLAGEDVGDERTDELMRRYEKHWGTTELPGKVLHREESFKLDGIGFTPDAIIEDENGDVWVWDYKTTDSIPSEEIGIMDYQHLMYIKGVRALYGPRVRGFVFDWMRSKPPTQPKLRKDGLIADINRVDTDWETLVEFAKVNKIPPYPELTMKLASLATQRAKWFRRDYIAIPEGAAETAWHEAWIVQSRIESAERDPQVGFTRSYQARGPYSCSSCAYQDVCQAELMGWDTAAIIGAYYKDRESLNRTYVDIRSARAK
jgi:hypothetical protein